MKRPIPKRLPVSRVWIIIGATLLVAAGLLLVLALLQPGSAAPETQRAGEAPRPTTRIPPSATPQPSPAGSPVVASVNGYTITRAYLDQSAALNQVLSEFAAQDPLADSDTLQRLIKQQLVIQGVALEETPTQEDVEAYLVRMQEAWGVDEQTILSALQAVGLERSFLEETIRRLLVVQAATDQLTNGGHDINSWLTEQEKTADIRILQDVSKVPPNVSVQPKPTTTPTAARAPRSEALSTAPDFTVEQAGGGTFSLSEQLEEGPLVLVFFQRCG